MVHAALIVFNVQLELLQVCGPLLMVVILQLSLCFHELHRLVINVDDCFLSQNTMLSFSTCLHNGIHLLVIGGISMNTIR
jgi:hypothetical protein